MMKRIEYLLITVFCLSCLKGLGGVKPLSNPSTNILSDFQQVNRHQAKSDSLIISDVEFHRLLDLISKANSSYTLSETRISLRDIYKEIVFVFQKTEFTEEKKRAFSVNQVDSMISHIKVNNHLFTMKIGDLLNAKIITETEIVKLRNDFVMIGKRLLALKKNASLRFEKEDRVFYKVSEGLFHADD